MAFYDIFELLCKEREITPTQAARENGISQGVVSMWKRRGSTPSATSLVKLADYFGVSVDYLIGVDDSVIATAAERTLTRTKELSTIYEKLKSSPDSDEKIQDMNRLRQELSFLLGEIGDSAGELAILASYKLLNDKGKQVAVERINELTKIPDYQRTDSPPEPTQDSPEDKK